MNPKSPTCQAERERPIVTTKETRRALSVATQYYEAHGSDETSYVGLFFIEKGLQRRLSNSRKQMHVTAFFF
jgi:hypothetical protein